MTLITMSTEQLAVVQHSGSVYVQACPGAGKTRTLVARTVRLADTLPPARALALLSFTNSAAEEFKERLIKVGAVNLLKPPHFVGTIDSFLARFVVMPRGNPWAPNLPIRHVESWKGHLVPVSIGITAKGANDFRQLPLSAFPVNRISATGDISVRLDLDRLARESGRGLASQIEARGSAVISRAEATASKVLNARLTQGQLSPAEIRLLATEFLLKGDEFSVAHIENLVGRFPMLVVDEAQDCDADVLRLLRQLEHAGTELTLIADPDQCIYTWRGADPKGLSELSGAWGKQPKLSGNYRSSPSICQVASTFKDAFSIDESKGDNSTCKWPVFVAPMKSSAPSAAGHLFVSLLKQHGIDKSDAIVLAPSWSLAAGIASANLPNDSKLRLGGKIRIACFSARKRADPKSYKTLYDLVQRFLEKRMVREVGPYETRLIDDWLDREARRLACELLSSNPESKTWYEETVNVLDTLQLPPGVALSGTSIRKCLPKPSTPLNQELTSDAELSFSSVHHAKGREYMAVLYAAGRQVDDKFRNFMSDWESRREGSERRAVAYVGVTRAERLLLFVTPDKYLRQAKHLLERDGAKVVSL